MKTKTKSKAKAPAVENPNINCLMNTRCPKCGSFGPFYIVVETSVMVTDDGYDVAEGQDLGWGPQSHCTCKKCNYGAEMEKFAEANQVKTEWWNKRNLVDHVPAKPTVPVKPVLLGSIFDSNADLFGQYDPLFDEPDDWDGSKPLQ